MPEPPVPLEQLVQELILEPRGRAPGDPLPSSTSVLEPCPQESSPIAPLVNVGTRGLEVDRSGFAKRPVEPPTYNTSDSESEAEDKSRTFPAEKRKKDPAYHEVILNKTKAEGRRKQKGKWTTKRNIDKKREKKRVDNRIYEGDPWPALEEDAKAIHDIIPDMSTSRAEREKSTRRTGRRRSCAL